MSSASIGMATPSEVAIQTMRAWQLLHVLMRSSLRIDAA
jgi:hypothetical protein